MQPEPPRTSRSSRLSADKRQRKRPVGMQPQVPDHEILREIGTGAYGEVWLARSMTGAYRAVKVVWREDFASDELFIREFEGVLHYEPMARDLSGMVHILHVGRHGGEFPHYFYVMELADDAYTGIHIDPAAYTPRTLQSDRDMYGNRPMPLDYVLEAGCQLARALEGLHTEGLTHGDVKPANVIFINGRLKLADPGMVAGMETRAYAGTEGYIPPEGGGSPRADVYALAKMLYEMVTGLDRMSFPTLPDELPEGLDHRRWLGFNAIICRAAEPVVGKQSIVTAQQMAELLENLRDDTPRRRKQRRAAKAEPARRPRRWPWVLFGAAVLLTAAGMHFLPPDTPQRVARALQALREAPPAPTAQPTGRGMLYIGSVPAGASVYTEQGDYLDETPYGPVPMEAGKRVAFILRKDGYADAREEGVIPESGLLSLGGTLHPYRPPQPGQAWQDALGTRYEPAGGVHEAESAVTAAQFARFVKEAEPELTADLRYETEGDKLFTTQESMSAFTLWLTRLCEEAGTIGRDHSLLARAENGTERSGGLCAYRLCTVLVEKTPVTLYTNPAGAAVSLNGRPLGVTPMQDVSIPLAPYYLELRMPGYTTVRRSGLSPKGLVLNIIMQPNNAVVFGAEWINTLGMKLQPVGPTLMAAATEVRVSDYRAFCEATGREAPPATPFPQNEHHPVVNVSRADAESFAAWLTQRERESGAVEQTDTYRLPTDEEWSAMAGSAKEAGETPYERQQNVVGTMVEYPWGLKWPPVRSTGNFADMSAVPPLRADHVIPDYYDDFPYTAPVGCFAPNALGLHDLAGNVQEWVSGSYGGPAGFHFRDYGVTRGGDYGSFRPGQLSLHGRTPHPADTRRPTIGFRVVLERKR